MVKSNFNLIKLEADEGKVLDWANLDEHTEEIENSETGEKEIVIDHLYAKIVYLGTGDSTDNYVEIDAPEEEGNNGSNEN